jgi:AMIN domain
MRPLSRILSKPMLLTGCLGGLFLALAVSAPLQAQTSVRAVKVLESKDAVEIEVEASDRLVPQTRVLAGPDRLVVDFPNAVPGAQVRSQSVNRGEVKDVRVGLFQSKPPVTRIVLDLKTAQSYQIVSNGRSTIIKITGGAPEGGEDDSASTLQKHPGLVVANYVTGAKMVPVEAVAKPLDVTFRGGLLTIKANKASLSQVLSEVQQRTGAEIGMAAGAEQEMVVVDLGPAPAPEVLAELLHGSKFNFLILSSANDPLRLDRVILSQRTGGGAMQLQQAPFMSSEEEIPQPPPPPPQAQPFNQPAPPVATRPLPEAKDPDDTPDL